MASDVTPKKMNPKTTARSAANAVNATRRWRETPGAIN
jgi:hypothetical protein